MLGCAENDKVNVTAQAVNWQPARVATTLSWGKQKASQDANKLTSAVRLQNNRAY